MASYRGQTKGPFKRTRANHYQKQRRCRICRKKVDAGDLCYYCRKRRIS